MRDDRVKKNCPACDGFGYHEASPDEDCEVCEGDGMAVPEAIEEWRKKLNSAHQQGE